MRRRTKEAEHSTGQKVPKRDLKRCQKQLLFKADEGNRKTVDLGQMQPEIPEVACCKATQQVSNLWIFNADMLRNIWRTAKYDGCMLKK